jgi:hypothetical protein
MDMMFPWRFPACGALFLAVLGGCSTVSKLEPGKKEAQQHAQQVQALQLQVMRFGQRLAGPGEQPASDARPATRCIDRATDAHAEQ